MGWLGALAARVEDVSREGAKELRRLKSICFLCLFFAASRLRVRFHNSSSALMTARRSGGVGGEVGGRKMSHAKDRDDDGVHLD